MGYAENTSVPADRSRNEIERTLQRYGADAFSYGWEGDMAVIAFRAGGRMVRFTLTMPDKADADFTRSPSGRKARTDEQALKAWEQATRQRWRALALVVKAKLEAVESGITTFEEEFMAHILLPDGTTVGQFMGPQIETAYETGDMPSLLPANRQLGSGRKS